MSRTTKTTTAAAVIAALLAVGTPTAAQSPPATVTGSAECLYGGPAWMTTWTITTDYRYATVPAGIESGSTTTHQGDQTSATLEVIINVGDSNSPSYTVVTAVVDKPNCDAVEEPPRKECRKDDRRHERRDRDDRDRRWFGHSRGRR